MANHNEACEQGQSELEGYAAAEVTRQLERTQINKFHTKGGTGFAAEEANALTDKLHCRKVEITGTDNSLNGADRIVSGTSIQTKYYPDAKSTFNAAFAENGIYRYQSQLLEVPREQYDECLQLMRDKIREGKVPGFTDPNQAQDLVKQGEVTYKQARNIARAGNIDSLLYDVKTQAVSTGYLFAISFAVQYATCIWHGQSPENALKNSVNTALSVGSTSLVTGVIAAQVLRTKAAAMGVVSTKHVVKGIAQTQVGRAAIEKLVAVSLGKAVYGAAAMNHVSKLLRTNVITSVVATVVISTPDFYRAAIAKQISWTQFSKNLAVNASGVVGGVTGWMGGAAVGAAIGSVIPLVGTTAGSIVGGLVGAFGAGTAASAGTKTVLDHFIEDDAQRMLELSNQSLADVAYDFLLTEAEMNQLVEKVKSIVDLNWLRNMHQAGAKTNLDEQYLAYAYAHFEEICNELVTQRSRVLLPGPQPIGNEVIHIVSQFLEKKQDGYKPHSQPFSTH